MLIKMQTLTYDFFIALSLFLITIFIIISLFRVKIERYDEYLKIKSMERIMIDASEIWFIEGNPTYWNINDVRQLGLANDGEINLTKLEMLNNLSYSKFYTLIKSSAYNIKFQLYDISGRLIFEYPNIDVNGRNVIFFDRYAIFNKSIVKVRTIVWD
ncbi:MAG: hypothetical protein QXW01_02080 [Candidatus Aenigmatarchaeota archaeon]